MSPDTLTRDGVLRVEGTERLIYQPDEAPSDPMAMPGGESRDALEQGGGSERRHLAQRGFRNDFSGARGLTCWTCGMGQLMCCSCRDSHHGARQSSGALCRSAPRWRRVHGAVVIASEDLASTGGL